MTNDLSVKRSLKKILGSNAYLNGKLNKEYISDKIYNNDKLLSLVNNLVHPKVHENFNKWLINQSNNYIIYESALIFENSSENLFDKIICIRTPLNVIYDRLSLRDNYSKNKIDKILKIQLPQDIKCLKSDFCIENISIESLFSEIIKIHSSLS